LIIALALAALVSPAGAVAAPFNDAFDSATVIGGLPFDDSVDVQSAGAEGGEPSCGFGSPSHTVWYAFTPTSDGLIRVSAGGSWFSDTVLGVYRADTPGLGGLTQLSCAQYYFNSILVRVHAGSTYYVQAGTLSSSGGMLLLHVVGVPPPANDDFGAAIAIGTAPYADSQDLTGASVEPGEPTSNCYGTFIKTIWYRFTPTTTRSYSVWQNGWYGGLNVYAGSSFADLSRVACGGTFRAEAGTTYYIQAGSWIAESSLPMSVSLQVTPPPEVRFFSFLSDPSTYDVMVFDNFSYDPGGLGFESWAWDFGDGTTSSESVGRHRYAKDGDYTVVLNGTTRDGRIGSATSVAHVETHDVAILEFNTPAKGRMGKQATITVDIGNARYAETVYVELLKQTASGVESVGTSIKPVPGMSKGKTVTFSFAYVFTAEDLEIGKATFRANAEIRGHRDALLADNTAIAPSTVVTR
jgi:hypothetical protein